MAENTFVPADMLTTSQAAEIIGVDRTRIQQLCRAGTLPCVAIGEGGRKSYYVHHADVEAYQNRPVGRGWPRGRTRKEKPAPSSGAG